MRYKIVEYISNGFCHGYADVCDKDGEIMLWPTESGARDWLSKNSGFSTIEEALQHYTIKTHTN